MANPRDVTEIAKTTKADFNKVQGLLNGIAGSEKSMEKTWDDLVKQQITAQVERYDVGDDVVKKVLIDWHASVTLGNKRSKYFTPHISGFYMIFMVHGTWYEQYLNYVNNLQNEAGLSKPPSSKAFSKDMETITLKNPNSYMNLMATDIDVPDITEEYTSVSSRLRNSFVPSRNYFVSDFSISYIENINLDVMRYHEAWHKYLNLIKRGEVTGNLSGEDSKTICQEKNKGYFLEMPFSNAIWIAVFRPFTTEIQLLIKLIGVMPVTMPLKQIVGNRSQSKMTVLNISYKAADLQYKFFNNTKEMWEDSGALSSAFKREVMFPTD